MSVKFYLSVSKKNEGFYVRQEDARKLNSLNEQKYHVYLLVLAKILSKNFEYAKKLNVGKTVIVKRRLKQTRKY